MSSRGWVNKADARRGDGLIEVTGDMRRGGWIVGDVKCGEVRSMESGVQVDRWGGRSGGGQEWVWFGV